MSNSSSLVLFTVLGARVSSIIIAAWRWSRSSQGIDVGNDVVGCLVIAQYFGHQCHLRTVQVFGMSAADTLFEVFQLSDHIPVTHALEPRGVRRLHAPPVRTVAGSAGRIATQPFARSPLRRGRGRIVRQRLDVSDDVIYCGVVA